jgi:hypothetical protein
MVGSKADVRWARRWLACTLVVAMAALGLYMTAAAGLDTHPGASVGVLPPGEWTHDQVADATDLVRRAEAAAPDYADEAALMAAGFRDFGVLAPGGWAHWGNPSRFDDGRILDLSAPESLVYQRQPDGRLRFMAFMFQLAPGQGVTAVPEDLAWLPGWHTHGDICFKDDGTFAGYPFNGQCTTGQPGRTAMMHIWVADNACGHRFASIGIGGLGCGHGHTVTPPLFPGTVIVRPPHGTIPPAPPGDAHGAPGHDDGHSGGEHDAPPARKPVVAVRATPRFTG